MKELERSTEETEKQKQNALAALDRSAKEMGDALAAAKKEHEEALEVLFCGQLFGG